MADPAETLRLQQLIFSRDRGGRLVSDGLGLAQNESVMRCNPGQPVYVLLYAAAIVFFCYFYTALVFNPKETADNLKKVWILFLGSALVNRLHAISRRLSCG